MHKWSGGRVSNNIQVLNRQAMRLNGCFPNNTIYILQHGTSCRQRQSNLGIGCLEGWLQTERQA